MKEIQLLLRLRHSIIFWVQLPRTLRYLKQYSELITFSPISFAILQQREICLLCVHYVSKYASALVAYCRRANEMNFSPYFSRLLFHLFLSTFPSFRCVLFFFQPEGVLSAMAERKRLRLQTRLSFFFFLSFTAHYQQLAIAYSYEVEYTLLC